MNYTTGMIESSSHQCILFTNCECNNPLSIGAYTWCYFCMFKLGYAAYIPFIPLNFHVCKTVIVYDKKSMVVGHWSALYHMHIQIFCMITIIAYHQVFIAKIAGYQRGVGDHRVDQWWEGVMGQ